MKERNLYGTLMKMTMKEGEENDDVECFHDSFDRLLSSSNTSCSCSPNTGSDSEEDSNHTFDYDLPVAPRFPVGVSKDYDVWIVQPSSVQERRLKLMRQMGLTRDPSMLKHRPSLSLSMSNFGMEQFAGTFSSGHNDCDDDCAKVVDNRGIVRSRSDGDCRNHRGLGECDNDPNIRVFPGKPPRVKNGVECTRGSANHSEGMECDDVEDMASGGVCMIKNLDNGKEFVVDEVREDGMWKKIKEVGTGRHLTMEEFSTEMCVGTSPIVQELMRRQNFEDGNKDFLDSAADGSRSRMKKKGNLLRSIRNVASSVRGHKDRRSSDERDTSSEKGGRRSSSATDDSRDVLFHEPERVRVKQYGKSVKDLTGLYKSQEIQAHNGSIWAIKFSLDGKYLASAGEDCVIHVWQVVETERKGEFCFDKSEDGNYNLLFLANGSSEPSLDGHTEKKKRRGRSSISRKSVSFEQILVPETVFALLEKPICSFQGHLADVLDLSWSKSQQLLSSSMDKTVRLWDLSCKSCLKIFSHNDYVTCIQFNPVDDRYFISGSLDAKVRIWSIPDHQVIDWTDLHEMVTAACYTPDGQGALVGSYKGSCRLFSTSENKLQPKTQINLQNKKKKSHKKKITGFQFAPGSRSEVLITSADSRVRVVNGVDLVHKFKGFHNTHSQISASLTSNGKYVISASEDSYVYVWRHEAESQPNKGRCVTVTQSYEFFHCQDVSMAIPWPGASPNSRGLQDFCPRKRNCSIDHFEDVISSSHPTTPAEDSNESGSNNSPLNGTVTLSTESNKYLFDRISATWPEEKLVLAAKNRSPRRVSVDYSNGLSQNEPSAWGMVIVTAGLRGDIRTFQNFGFNVRI